MKLTLAFVATALTTTINAAPALSSRDPVPSITLAICNDQSGANAQVTVPTDGVARLIPDLFRGTPIDQNGAIIGTSAELTQFSDTTHCFLQNGNWIIDLFGRKNFADLDGRADVAIPVWLNGFNVQCVRA